MGTEQKMGSFSGAFDYYLDNSTLGLVFSPIHHTNRLPLGDDDFPIELPIVPGLELITNVDNELEFGAYFKHSYDKGDITLSYYKGNDRVYNLSGVNVFTNITETATTSIDTVFTYRQTDVIGIGGSFVTDVVTFRMDYGYFHTKDPDSDVQRNRPDKQDGTILADNWHHILATHAFEEDVYYDQTTLQLEFSGENSMLIFGLFKYNVKEYTANYLAEFNIPGVPVSNVNPRDYFYPGMGAPLAVLTENALIYQFQKEITSNTQLSIKGVNDLDNAGYLCEIGTIVNISDDMKIHLYLNKIIGNKTQDEDYRFNQMEDFSHFRLELEYFF